VLLEQVAIIDNYSLIDIRKDLACTKSLDAGGSLVVLMLLSIRKTAIAVFGIKQEKEKSYYKRKSALALKR